MMRYFKLKRKDLFNLSVIAMVLANMTPIIGILFLHWDTLVVISLYWSETLIVGFYAILKFVFAPAQRVKFGKKLIVIPLFSWFFGWFISGYGIAIVFFFVIFPNLNKPESEWSVSMPEGDFFNALWPGPLALFQLGIEAARVLYYVVPIGVGIPLFFLMMSHGVSFVNDYLVKGNRHHVNFGQLLGYPFARVFILHIALMVGGFLIFLFSPNMVIVICLVIVKCWMEVTLYQRQQSV